MTKVFLAALILGAALFPLAACQPAEQAGTSAQSAGQAPATPQQSAATATFVNTAGTLGLEEVRFARIAETKAADPAVRQVAETMIADLTTVNQHLAALAESKGMTPPSDMGGRHQMLYQQLQSLSGPAFDRAYASGELQDLTMATETFQSEADGGSDPQVRSFAQQYLPMLLEHVRMMDTIAGP